MLWVFLVLAVLVVSTLTSTGLCVVLHARRRHWQACPAFPPKPFADRHVPAQTPLARGSRMELRTARRSDIPALETLIELSARALSVGHYSPEQADAITRHVFGVDTQLIDDRTFFVIEADARLLACGGWSRRRTLFGGDQAKTGPDPLLDPSVEPARIRAFFVHPSMARRGLGRRLMAACLVAAGRAGFSSLELVATVPGEPLYLASGFAVVERFDLDLPGGVRVPVARMGMAL